MIEFIGIPGSGKSTIVRNLLKLDHEFADLRSVANRQAVIDSIRYFCRYESLTDPARSLSQFLRHDGLLNYLISNSDAQETRRLGKLISTTLQCIGGLDIFPSDQIWLTNRLREQVLHQLFHDANNKKRRFVFSDEHFAQNIVSITGIRRGQNWNTDLESLMDATMSVDLVVAIGLDPDLALSRMEKRRAGIPRSITGNWTGHPKKPSEHSESFVRKTLTNAQESVVLYCAGMEKRGVQVITVENQGALADICDLIKTEILAVCK